MATDTNLDVESHVVEEASRKLRDARSRTLNPQEIERIDIVGKHLEQSSSATRAMFERDSEVAITQISRLHYDPDLGMRQEKKESRWGGGKLVYLNLSLTISSKNTFQFYLKKRVGRTLMKKLTSEL